MRLDVMTPVSMRRPAAGWSLSLLLVAGLPWMATQAYAQGSAGVTVVPTFSLSQTLTDNRKLSSTDRQADLITTLSPGVQITSRSGAVQGSLTYSANGLFYAKDTSASNLQHQLVAAGSAELIERRLGVDASTSISQQAISAFGTQSTSSSADNGNRAEVVSYSLAPYLRGRLLGEADYQARLTYSGSSSGAGSIGDTSSLSGSMGLSGTFGRFGWGLDASRSATEYSNGRRSFSGRAGGSLSATPDPEVRVALRLARDAGDVSTGSSSVISWGGGATWTPTPRTTLSLDADRRYFGNSHTLSFQHRFARSSWSYSDSRSVSTGAVSGGSSFSLYNIFFVQLASLEPDPVKRDVLVRDLLRKNGLEVPSTNIGGFLTSSSSVSRTRTLTFTLQGLRDTYTLSTFQSTSTSLGSSVDTGDLGQASEVRQQGITFAFSYRLDPTSSLSVFGSTQKTLDSGRLAGNDLRTVTATWQASLGLRTQVSLGLRYAVFDAELNPYHETALLGSLSLRF